MLKRHLKKPLLAVASAIKLPELKVSRLHSHQIIILNAHQVHPEGKGPYPSLTPDVFCKLCVWIKNTFEVTRFSELGSHRKGNGKRPKIILSFDDGYYDFMEYAMPIMDECGIACNLNVIGECIELQTPPFTVQLAEAISGLSDYNLKNIVIPGFNEKFHVRNRETWGIRLSNYLKSMPQSPRQAVIEGASPVLRESLQRSRESIRMMSAKDIQSISKYVEIGNHSYTHESMKYQPREFFEEDFKKAQKLLEKLRITAEIYAFPNGSYDDSQIDYLKKNGIKHVLLVNKHVSDIHNTVHERITFYASSVAEAKVRASGLLC